MSNVKETVMQFGEGVFLRGFVDYFFHKLREKGLYDGKIVVVQPIEKGMCQVLADQHCEYNLFLRGIVPMIGYRTSTVEYERGERFAGESKYPLKKMLSFAMEGITSLSTKPIRYITGLGFLIFMVSIAMIIYNVVRWITGNTVTGWASLACSLWAIGGLILLALGVIGEYIGKIYLETKGRPRFLVREVLEETDEKAP